MSLNMQRTFFLALCTSLAWALTAEAVPVLQVGAPGGSGEGTYANYQVSLSNPSENDTAVTSGSKLFVAGAYKANANPPELLLGGQYTDPADGTLTKEITPGLKGLNWSDFGFSTVFDTHRAVLMATVSNTTLGAGTIKVNGSDAFYTTDTYEDGFEVPDPPSNHDPIKNQDYLFFDIGNFGRSTLIPNFADEMTGTQMGEIKELSIAITGYDWVHFDVFALMTVEAVDVDKYKGTVIKTFVATDDHGNPGSHDVTWKPDGDIPPHEVIPEPGTIILLGSGLLGLALYGRRRLGR